MTKTNALRLLDAAKISYNTYEYDTSDGLIDGVSVARKTGRPPELVYKTLVAVGASGLNYVFVIPVEFELNLKLAAKAAKEKNIEMIRLADLERLTGYVRGGCSAIGMKKKFTTVIDETAMLYDKIIVSAGRVGLQMELAPHDLAETAGASFAELI